MQILIGIFMLGVTSLAYSQTTQQPFTISISADKQEVKSGGDVYLHVTMTNTSDHDIECTRNWSNALDRNYRYDVIDEFGQHLPKILRSHHDDFNISPCIVKPGETSLPSGGLISVLYDFSRPGKYTVQASRRFLDTSDELVKSNVVTVTVLAPEPEADTPK
jgi:hypothetical protein